MVTVKDCIELMEFGSKQSLNNVANQIKKAINATDIYDTYGIGFRNGLRYGLSLIDGKEPEYEMDGKEK